MATFFILLLIGILLWPVVRVWLTVRRMQKTARDAYSQFARDAREQQRSRRPAGWSTPRPTPRTKKKIDPGVGEYVEWEEISTASTTVETDGATSDSARKTRTRVTTESRIVDVEWEDL